MRGGSRDCPDSWTVASLQRLKDRVRQSPWLVERVLTFTWSVLRLEWPRPVAQAKALLTTRRPRTYSQKVRYKMARDRRPILTTWADKLAVRDYVAEKVGTERLLTVYSRSHAARDLDWESLPREYVLKVNHGCGGMIIVTESASRSRRLPIPGPRSRWSRHVIHPDAADTDQMIALLDSWLALRYGWGPGSRWEWAYWAIEPTAYAEEYIGREGPARNLKLHCIHGEPLVATITHLADDLMGDIPETRFLVADAATTVESWGIPLDEWKEVESMSRKLSSETDFVRLDWLIGGTGIRFGEFTSYPSAGTGSVMGTADMSGPALAAWLFDSWTLPARYG